MRLVHSWTQHGNPSGSQFLCPFRDWSTCKPMFSFFLCFLVVWERCNSWRGLCGYAYLTVFLEGKYPHLHLHPLYSKWLYMTIYSTCDVMRTIEIPNWKICLKHAEHFRTSFWEPFLFLRITCRKKYCLIFKIYLKSNHQKNWLRITLLQK